MKILNPIGSKERFFEMYQGVNKLQLNEVATNAMQTGSQLVEKAFNELKNKEINVKQTNTQAVDDGSFVEILAYDNNGNEITFRFKINSTEGDQDGVYNIGNAVLNEFKIKSDRFNVDFPENMKAVQEFNNNHGDDIMSVVEQYADFDVDDYKIDNEIYEEAINLIDKIPFKKGTEEIQTNSAYGDEKPTNPDLRVHSTELEKFVSEMEDYVNNAEEDILALPDEHDDTELPNDDSSKGIDPYDQAIADAQAGNSDWEISKKPEKPKYHPPYMEKNPNRERAIPSWAEDFMEENHMVRDVDADNIVNRNYNKLLSPEKKEFLIKKADEELENQLGVKKYQIPKDKYILMVKNLAIKLFQVGSQGVNEESEKNDYPDQIGKKFKPKNQFPKKKKKPQSVVKLGEEDEPIKLTGEYGSVIVGDNLNDIDFEDQIEGGLADDKEPANFDPKQLAMGLEVELEHTDDPKIALEIAMDHLMEIPDYYTHLDKMEREAGVDEPKQDSEEIETDELLGYKPHNVNDYVDENDEINSIPKEYVQEFQALIDEFGERPVNYVFKNGIQGYYESRTKGHYSFDGTKQTLRFLTKDNGVNEDMEEYSGDIGDRFQDAEGEQYTVQAKDDDGVKLQGQDGEKEVDTSDLQLLKKISEEKENNKEIITEEQIKTARLVLKDRDFSNTMTKKEAVQLLIKHNIR